MLARGCSAAARSATAGAGALVLDVVLLGLDDGLAADDDEAGEEDPHPAMTRAASGARRRTERSLMAIGDPADRLATRALRGAARQYARTLRVKML
jgi:hypothetical protein